MRKIYGIRICRFCRAICHKNSYRREIGLRKRYYCSRDCVENSIIERIKKGLSGLANLNIRLAKEHANEMIKEYYKKIDVITP